MSLGLVIWGIVAAIMFFSAIALIMEPIFRPAGFLLLAVVIGFTLLIRYRDKIRL